MVYRERVIIDAVNKDVFLLNSKKINIKKGKTENNIGIMVIIFVFYHIKANFKIVAKINLWYICII